MLFTLGRTEPLLLGACPWCEESHDDGDGGGDEGDDAGGVAINIPVGWDAEASGRSDLTRLSGGPMWSQRLSSSTPGDPHRGGGDDGTWWVWWWWRWCNVRGGGLQCARLF